MTSSTRKTAERRPRENDAPATKTRLLDVAARLFAEKGHDGVSVRDITSRAKTNIAAIAYHFGGKEGLYVAALRHAVQKTIGGMHAETGATTTDPLETLHRYVHD